MAAGARALLHILTDDIGKLSVDAAQSIALLGDGVGEHLQLRMAEDLAGLELVIRAGAVELETVGDRADDAQLDALIGQQSHFHGQMIVRLINLIDDRAVIAGHRNDA